MNVTEKEIIKYVQVFHEELSEISSKFLSSEQAMMLLHQSLLPARIVCYISTQFGLAIEYIKSERTSIETIRGSSRIEELFINSPARLSKLNPIIKISCANVSMEGMVLEGGFPFRLDHQSASASFKKSSFSIQGLNWKKDIDYAEVNGNREKSNWSIDAAKNRAKEEVLAALFELKQAEKSEMDIHKYISTSKEKNVLVLGAYNPEGERRIDNISKILRTLGYIPVLIKDIPDFECFDVSQKVSAVGALSRFVVMDDSSPSGHLAEFEICKSNRWVTVLLRENGMPGSFMTVGASVTSNVILERNYDSVSLFENIQFSTNWAENKLKEIGKKLNGIYPWRIL